MAIEHRKPKRALETFRERLNSLLRDTITAAPLAPIFAPRPPDGFTAHAEFSFRDGGRPTAVPLQSKLGELRLYVGQVCATHIVGGPLRRTHRVSTQAYTYHLYVGGAHEPLLRWEYLKQWPDEDARWCRHHLQGPTALDFGSSRVSMADLHMPTGYVTLEDVIRFCICDLGVQPLDPRKDWHQRLEQTYDEFRSESSPPR